MPDPTTPPAGDAGLFTYEINEQGNLLIDGDFAGKVSDPHTEDASEEAPVVEPVEPPEPEAAKEEKPPEAKPVPPPEPILPERVKLKLKVYGEESEREFTREELVAQVQKGLAAEKRFQDVAEKERAIEPFLHIKDSPEFKEWLSNMVQENPSLAPVAPPPPSPEDVMGYRLRREEPESAEIVEAMKDWQATLPVYEAKALENNHRVFNMTYDRFKAARQSKTAPAVAPAAAPAKTEPAPIQNKEEAEKIIAAKEKQKDSARTIPPSVAAGERDEAQARKKQEAELRKRARSGDRNAEFALAALLYGNEL
jgi:hypothetical protein